MIIRSIILSSVFYAVLSYTVLSYIFGVFFCIYTTRFYYYYPATTLRPDMWRVNILKYESLLNKLMLFLQMKYIQTVMKRMTRCNNERTLPSAVTSTCWDPYHIGHINPLDLSSQDNNNFMLMNLLGKKSPYSNMVYIKDYRIEYRFYNLWCILNYVQHVTEQW